MFDKDGYVYKISDKSEKVYDGKNLPENPKEDNYLFRTKIAKYPTEIMEHPRGIWVSLPMHDSKLSDVKNALGVIRWKDCVLQGVQSIIPNMQYSIESASEIESLNKLAHKILELNEMEQSKYKALLETVKCSDVQTALRLLDCLDNFCLHREKFSYADYGREALVKKDKIKLPDSLITYFNFENYLRETLGSVRIYKTEYGILEQTNEKFHIEEYVQKPESDLEWQEANEDGDNQNNAGESC